MKAKLGFEEKTKIVYPYLGIHKDSELVVFFLCNGEGVVVHPNYAHNVGYYSTTWMENGDFIPFGGKVILSN